MGYDNLRLEKGMYRQEGKNFTQVLESLDPSENYRGTALEGTDAFQRQLKRFGIRVKGAGSSPVEKFFRTMDSAVLFPEYIARTVRQGLEENDILPAITASTTVIDSMDYRSIYSLPADEDKALRNVEEGTAIPATQIKTKEHLVRLNKRGRMLIASYEAIRFQKLDLFSVMLRQIGAYIQKMQVADAVDVLRSGDGNENPAVVYQVGTEPISGTAGKLEYDQLVEFWGQFDPYTMNTILCSTATMTKLLMIPELQNPLTGLNFQGTGKVGTPLGAQLHRTSAVGEDVLIGLDNRYALELIRAGDVLVEYDKLIDRQLERAAITAISGFGKISAEASAVLQI
ncbi:MAG TPA: phage major capsid protein [Candidatus Faecousia intestinigallinarum]|nr:phage major capsid protein [Candidatus Faecousia intestinigallinarum]